MSIKVSAAAMLALCSLAVTVHGTAQTRPVSIRPQGSKSVFVSSAFGGTIFGYAIDENGTEGVLSEEAESTVGRAAFVETFDVRTGEITSIVQSDASSHVDYVTLGIFEHHIGLVEQETGDPYVDGRRYLLSSPLQGHAITGEWTPPLTANDIIWGVGTNQFAQARVLKRTTRGQSLYSSAFLGQTNGSQDSMYVFGANLETNVSGPIIHLDNPVFQDYSTQLAAHLWGSRAVLIGSGGPMVAPVFASVDLGTGDIDTFAGLGWGDVLGLDLDPLTGIACATTYGDSGITFYNLNTHSGFETQPPSGSTPNTVRFDPVNKLFLIAQPAATSYIQVYDEQGNYLETIDQGFHLPASPVAIAISPTLRIGYVLETPALNRLQSFTY